MAYMLIAYIAFSIILIARDLKNKNIIWFSIMLTGFCLAFTGLAVYTEYIYNAHYTDSKLFANISKYIWIIDYYFRFDILKTYNIMNVGTAMYICGALSFSFSYINNRKFKKAGIVISVVIAVLIVVFNNPKFLSIVMGLEGKDYYEDLYNMTNDSFIKAINLVSNVIIKISIIASIVIFIYVYRRIIPILRVKFIYMIIGIIPTHVLFLTLFYWFPDSKIAFARYLQLKNLSLPYNQFLYGFITYFSIFSIILLVYTMLKYNIFEINRRENRITFQKKVAAANLSLKVFSHSIKNQFVAIKLFAEQMQKTNDQEIKNEYINEIFDICNSSIQKLISSSRQMEDVKLIYSNVNVNEVIQKVINRNKKMNSNIKINISGEEDMILYIDEKQFEKVIDNIIINAVEACENVKEPAINIEADQRDSYGIICIKDNGSGIDKKHVKKVFEPFYSTKPTVSNWGIGLSFCQKVIEAFGGTISIESEIDIGTKVYIYIPKVLES